MSLLRAKVLQKAAILTILSALSLTATSCWNRREIESLGFVSAVGIDRSKEDDQIELTVHIVKPFAMGTVEQGSSLEKPFWVASAKGRTTFDAIRNFLDISPRRLFWAHNNLIVFGEELARKGVLDVIDVFYRDGEPRRRANILVVQGTTAREFLQAEFELERLPAEGIRGILLAARTGLSTIATPTLNDFLQMLEDEGVEPVALRAEIIPKRQTFDITGDLLRTEVKALGRLSGAAVFKDDKLVGWLDKYETRGLNWVKGQVKSGILVINQPGQEDKFIGLEILRAKGGVKPETTDDRIVFTVKVEAEANVGDVQGFINFMDPPEIWSVLEQRMADAIRNEIMAAVAKAKQLGSDVFGFGAELGRKNPKQWAKLKDRWDEEFRRIDVKVEVKAKLRRFGLASRRVKVK